MELLLEYIRLLEDELDEVVPLAASLGWKSTRHEEGKRLRAKISSQVEPREPIIKGKIKTAGHSQECNCAECRILDKVFNGF